ncbi:unnamed protein product [Arabis nemorensis]|uniref:Uncharacterized protein n=1 Tax=Arabis nemorensis TaxID=586526 RepID=A0A565BQI8_9BRAS|nr:unnamed protein product [Arabis nemorensis]
MVEIDTQDATRRYARAVKTGLEVMNNNAVDVPELRLNIASMRFQMRELREIQDFVNKEDA